MPSFRALLPPSVALAEHAGPLDIDAFPPLFADEAADAERMVLSRRAEFVAGRALVRQAMHALGAPAFPIPRRADRSPVWPAGVTGSITHCEAFVAAAAARSGEVHGLGIDVERLSRIKPDILSHIGTDAERTRAAALSPAAMQLQTAVTFVAKECVQKAWGAALDVILPFNAVEGTACYGESGESVLEVRDAQLIGMRGAAPIVFRWQVIDDYVMAAIVE